MFYIKGIFINNWESFLLNNYSKSTRPIVFKEVEKMMHYKDMVWYILFTNAFLLLTSLVHAILVVWNIKKIVPFLYIQNLLIALIYISFLPFHMNFVIFLSLIKIFLIFYLKLFNKLYLIDKSENFKPDFICTLIPHELKSFNI